MGRMTGRAVGYFAGYPIPGRDFFGRSRGWFGCGGGEEARLLKEEAKDLKRHLKELEGYKRLSKKQSPIYKKGGK